MSQEDFTLDVEYTTQGKVTGLVGQSLWDRTVHGEMHLIDGRVFGYDFLAGTTTVPIPVNVVNLDFTVLGDPVWVGVHSFRVW